MLSNDVTPTERFTGRVKWFNDKSGYGFITITDGERSGSDIFIHHSAINVENQYKYLVQGEYVEFSLTKTTSGNHEWQASSVGGIKGGKLMCETRQELKIARNSHQPINRGEPRTGREPLITSEPRQGRGGPGRGRGGPGPGRGQTRELRQRGRGGAEQGSECVKKEWTLVSK